MKREMQKDEIIFKCDAISKNFSGNEVLRDVTLQCRKGSVLALVGENGAGKSTLTNIISGNLKASSGKIQYKGKELKLKSSAQALEKGIAVVYQRLSLIPELSVAENIFLGKEKQFGKAILHNKKIHELAQKEIDEIEGFSINASKVVSGLTPAERQMVEIIKAWSTRPQLMILDEPTSSLASKEVKYLMKLIQKLKAQGTAFIFISHRLDEIFAICDDVVVLKDGNLTLRSPVSQVTKDDLVCAMVGREREESSLFTKRKKELTETLVEIKDASTGKKIKGASLKIRKGEIVGVAGLEGQGQRELIRAMFGIHPFLSGSYLWEGKEIKIISPKEAMKRDIAYIPDDRDTEGMVRSMSVADNLTLITLKEISKYGIVIKSMEEKSIQEGMNSLAVKAPSHEVPIAVLSGGNQQKVIFNKWLKKKPKLLLLHEPTRGIDIQAKEEIYKLLHTLSEQGVSTLFVSSDMIELMDVSDRIVVMYEGKITGEIPGGEATEENIMRLSSGESIKEE